MSALGPPALLAEGASLQDWPALAWGLVLGSYLLGALPFGLLIARLFKGIDLREMGSGNIGATNTIRAVGKPLGLTAFVLDFAKGWAPVYLFLGMRRFYQDSRLKTFLKFVVLTQSYMVLGLITLAAVFVVSLLTP